MENIKEMHTFKHTYKDNEYTIVLNCDKYDIDAGLKKYNPDKIKVLIQRSIEGSGTFNVYFYTSEKFLTDVENWKDYFADQFEFVYSRAGNPDF
jgi:hypothetical protein